MSFPSLLTFMKGQIFNTFPTKPAVFEIRPPLIKNVRSDEKNQWFTSSLCSMVQFASVSISMPLSLRSASLSIKSPKPDDAASESITYIFLSGYSSSRASFASLAELTVPDIPELSAQ